MDYLSDIVHTLYTNVFAIFCLVSFVIFLRNQLVWIFINFLDVKETFCRFIVLDSFSGILK